MSSTTIPQPFRLPAFITNSVLDAEEKLTAEGFDGDDEDANEEDWVDEQANMLDVDRAELDASVLPVKLVLVKVSRHRLSQFTHLKQLAAPQTSIAIKNSTTIILH